MDVTADDIAVMGAAHHGESPTALAVEASHFGYSYGEWVKETPEVRVMIRARVRMERQLERENTPKRPVSAGALAEKFGWPPDLLAHLVQPYCYCEIRHDGWQWCEHAYDEGFTE